MEVWIQDDKKYFNLSKLPLAISSHDWQQGCLTESPCVRDWDVPENVCSCPASFEIRLWLLACNHRTWTCFDWEDVWMYLRLLAYAARICSNSSCLRCSIHQRGCRLLCSCSVGHHWQFLSRRHLYSWRNFMKVRARVFLYAVGWS